MNRFSIMIICFMFLLVGCHGGSGGDSHNDGQGSGIIPDPPVYADDDIPGELDVIRYVSMGDIPIIWRPATTDIDGNPFLENDQLLFWVYAWRVSSRDPKRITRKELKGEIALEQVLREDGWCAMTIYLNEPGVWAMGVLGQIERWDEDIQDYVWIEQESINWSDDFDNQGAAGLWRVCDPDQMPPKSATELATELATE